MTVESEEIAEAAEKAGATISASAAKLNGASAPAAPTMRDLHPQAPDPRLFLNRELSLLEFHARVLGEALDENNPLLERVRFLAIFNSNMDEFFMIRVAGLHEQVKAGVSDLSLDGMTPSQEMAEIHKRALALLDDEFALFRDTLCPALAKQGIRILDYNELSHEQAEAAREYFDKMVYPVCTPLAVDPGHPFPHISNLSLNLAVELQEPDGQRRFARVKVPNVLPRLVPLPAGDEKARAHTGRGEPMAFLWLEQLLSAHMGALFPQMQLLGIHPFRVIRDADLDIPELDADDLLETVEQSLARRRFGSAVALCTNPGIPAHLRVLLMENLELDEDDTYTVEGPLGMADLSDLYRIDRPDLKDPSFTPRVPPGFRGGGNVFYAIQEGDILLHNPYDSFAPVVDFIRAAAADRDVLAIKQTLYRVGSHSPIVEALLEAAQAGKQVAVLVEVKARGDEENNIEWARAMEQAGVHVTYGLIGLKTHCKVALVVRKEGDGLRRYVHLGTGNYNPTTARQYTDMGLLTCRPDFGADASDLFNYLTGYSKQTRYRKLLVAPISMRAGMIASIEREIKRHKESKDGRIILKMNHLVDQPVIEALYKASRAGVKIDLIVRGMCSLRPGVRGESQNITVTRIVGRFLEHSRIFYFYNGGKEEVLLGSADMMPRNLDNRVEVLFPVEDEGIRNYIAHDLLEAYLRDNVKASTLKSNGQYVRRLPGENDPPFEVQAFFLSQTGTDPNDLSTGISALPKKYRKHLSGYGRANPHD